MDPQNESLSDRNDARDAHDDRQGEWMKEIAYLDDFAELSAEDQEAEDRARWGTSCP